MKESTEEIQEIIQAKYSGTQFREMDLLELVTSCKILLGDLKLITGGLLPTGPSFERLAQIFAQAFQKDYGWLTVPEVQLAINRHSSQIPIFGKDINLVYISKVLNLYLPSKQVATDIEDKFHQRFFDQKKINAEELDNLTREAIQRSYAHYMQTGEYKLLSDVEYNQLVKDKLISNDLHEDYIFRALYVMKERYRRFMEESRNKNNDAKAFSRDNDTLTGVVDGRHYAEKLKIITEIEKEAKTEAVKFAFLYAAKKNVVALYTKDKNEPQVEQ